ncbi:MAG: nuclear transport factor 2 family protein [Chloroflexota bacterium]|nr:nuclear transport factor 2 family protein [Chloroflexota bacterium]
MHRLFVTTAALVVAIIAAAPSGGYAQASDPVSVMEAFNDAATDPEAAVQYLADDVTIRIIPPPPGRSGVWTGKEEARGFLEFTKSQDVRHDLVGTWQVEGNTVSGTVMVSTKDFTALGVAPVEHTLEAVVEDGEITSWTSTMSRAERERLGAVRSAQQPGSMPGASAGGSARSSGVYPMLTLGGLVLALGLVLRLTRVCIR